MNAQLPADYFPDIPSAQAAVPEAAAPVPRFRDVGDLTLDLFNHDGRVDAEWLGLSLQEFALLWRLAAAPGKRLTSPELSADASRVAIDPGGDAIAVHVSQARAKLVAAGLPHLLRSDPEDGHFIEPPPVGSDLPPFAEG